MNKRYFWLLVLTFTSLMLVASKDTDNSFKLGDGSAGTKQIEFDTGDGASNAKITTDGTSIDASVPLNTPSGSTLTSPTITNPTVTGGSLSGTRIDQGVASDATRVTIPAAGRSFLDALTRDEGTLYYDETNDNVVFDNGTKLQRIFPDSSAVNFVTNSDFEEQVAGAVCEGATVANGATAIVTATQPTILTGKKSCLVDFGASATAYVDFSLETLDEAYTDGLEVFSAFYAKGVTAYSADAEYGIYNVTDSTDVAASFRTVENAEKRYPILPSALASGKTYVIRFRATAGASGTVSLDGLFLGDLAVPVAGLVPASGVQDGFVTQVAQTFEGVKTFLQTIAGNITGNAGTVTNGVYTTGNQTIAGEKTLSDDLIANANVGIGIANPSHDLSVGTDLTPLSGDPTIAIGSSTNSNMFLGNDSNNYGFLQWEGSGDFLRFQTRSGGTTYSNHLILEDGKVGINGIPSSLLDLNQGSQTSGTISDSSTAIKIKGTNDSSSLYGGIQWEFSGDGIVPSSNGFSLIGATAGGTRSLRYMYDNAIAFEVAQNGRTKFGIDGSTDTGMRHIFEMPSVFSLDYTSTDSIQLGSAGSVGTPTIVSSAVGSTSGDYNLFSALISDNNSVSYAMRFNIGVSGSGNDFSTRTNSEIGWVWTKGSTTRMSLTQGGQLATTTGTVGTVSDQRLKKDVEKLENALETVLNLNPVNYNWIDDRDNPTTGFIAQEVEKVTPMWVHRDGNSGYLNVNMGVSTFAYVVKAIQEQQEIIEEQGERIEELSAENNTIRAQISILKEALCAKDDSYPFCA